MNNQSRRHQRHDLPLSYVADTDQIVEEVGGFVISKVFFGKHFLGVYILEDTEGKLSSRYTSK